MLQESIDLKAEADDLKALLERLTPEQWNQPTKFMDWTPWDVVAHLHYFDEVGMLSLAGLETFAPKRDQLIEFYAAGRSNAAIAREEYGQMDAATLLQKWRATCDTMATQLGESDPKRRLPWFGPDMGVRMFTTARFMETWAHAQAVYDLLGEERPINDRIRHIATIGVKTFGWTFVNRQQEIPGEPPYVRLEAPSGEIWEWNEPSDQEYVRGSALDFCRVVTQTRNVADTPLEVKGDVAGSWMKIAQCFAGPAVDPPPAGARG